MKLITLLLLFVSATTLASTANRSILPLPPGEYNRNAEVCCFLDWGTAGWFSKSVPFPDANVYELKTGKLVKLRELVKKRPIVLQTGSVTCPSYDINFAKIKELQKTYAGRVDFYTLYVRENHPNTKYSAHSSFEQKVQSARDLVTRDQLEQTVLVDDLKGSLHQALGNYGNSVYVIGTDMYVNHWSIFTSPTRLARGIENLLRAKGVARNAAFVGGTDIHPLASDEFTPADKKAGAQRMQSLSTEEYEKSVSYESEVSKLGTLGPDTKPVYEKMPKDLKQKIDAFLKWSTAKEKTPGSFMRDLQVRFRDIYRERYRKWKSLNGIEDPSEEGASSL